MVSSDSTASGAAGMKVFFNHNGACIFIAVNIRRLSPETFPRSVAADIEHLLQLANQAGVRTNLAGRREYLIQACAAPEVRDCELFREFYFLKALRNVGWNCAVIYTHQWKHSTLQKNGNKNLILQAKNIMNNDFQQKVN